MKIKCSACGKLVGTTKATLQKRLQRYGLKTKEELEKVYKCMDCRRKEKAKAIYALL